MALLFIQPSTYCSLQEEASPNYSKENKANYENKKTLISKLSLKNLKREETYRHSPSLSYFSRSSFSFFSEIGGALPMMPHGTEVSLKFQRRVAVDFGFWIKTKWTNNSRAKCRPQNMKPLSSIWLEYLILYLWFEDVLKWMFEFQSLLVSGKSGPKFIQDCLSIPIDVECQVYCWLYITRCDWLDLGTTRNDMYLNQ